MAAGEPSRLVTVPEVDNAELLKLDDDLNLLMKVFGESGIISIAGIPGYVALRHKVLLLVHRVAYLPDEVKQKVEDVLGKYSFGWSHGKETLTGEKKEDTDKGSYYANPLTDEPTTDLALIKKYPGYARPNLWLKDDLPELEGAIKDLGRLMYEVGLRLALHLDKYVASLNPAYEKGKLVRIFEASKCHKARLLYYYPAVSTDKDAHNTWCGWHRDLSSMTGLTAALYMNKEGEEVPNPDPESGLYVEDRNGRVLKAVFPEANLAFQIGNTMQIHSGGVLQATRHCVKAAHGEAAVGIGRGSYALFLQPHWDEPVDLPDQSEEDALVGVVHYEDGLTFGDFAEKSIKTNYKQ